MGSPSEIDPLALVEASPQLVLDKDKEGWLSIYTDDAIVEDPVGASTYWGRDQISSFWDVFIEPQRRIVFQPQRDFVSPQRVVRHVRIETETGVSPRPLVVEAILEYRLRGELIESMRAFWNPWVPVRWHLRQGLGGYAGLLRHGVRLTTGLGPWNAMDFGRALWPPLTLERGRAAMERVAAGSKDDWEQVARSARVELWGAERSEPVEGLDAVWERARSSGTLRADTVIVAGDHAAAVLLGEGREFGIIARLDGDALTDLSIVERVD